MTALTKIINESNLPQTEAKAVLEGFQKYFDEVSWYEKRAREIIVSDETQIELMQEARKLRLELQKIRGNVEEKRKKGKEKIVREGKAIDGIANIIKAIIVPIEEHLKNQEKYKETIEKERKEEINNQRIIKLSHYVENVELYQLKEMSEEAFEKLLKTSVVAFNAQKEAELKAIQEKEEQEKQLQEERERIRIENIKLKKEQEEQGKKLTEERKNQEKERLIQEAKYKKLQEEKEKQLQEEQEKREQESLIQEAKLKKEQEEREKIEAKIKAEQKAKEVEKVREAEQKRKELLAPDKQKLLAFAVVIDKIEFPNMANREAGKKIDIAQDMLIKISQYIREQAKKI